MTSLEKGGVFLAMEACKLIQDVLKQSIDIENLAPEIVTCDFEMIFSKASLRRELICRSKLDFGISRINLGASMMSYK